MNGRGLGTLTLDGAKRIARQATRSERKSYGGGIPPRRRYPVPTAPRGGLIAKTGSLGIGPMSGLHPGSATVTLYRFDPATEDLVLTTATVKAFNTYGSIGANLIIHLARELGRWFVIAVQCG